ncbi:MAG TPA: DUF4349 domain-containing protein [Longimicrobium sp.]
MRTLTRIFAVLAPLLLAGCSKDAGSSLEREQVVDLDVPAEAPKPGGTASPATPADVARQVGQGGARPDTAGGPPTAPGTDSVIPQMIIREGTATVRVDSLEIAIAQVQQLAQRLGGYVANTSMRTGAENAREASLELKIPSARWDQALGGLKPVGKLESQQTSTEDVGEEYVDVTARMQNARRLEERLVTLLATRTGRLEDVLAVERELARVREEIERYEGRLRYLRSRVSMSTLTVVLHERYPVLSPGHNPIVDAFAEAWRNFVGFLAGFIAMLGWLVPLVLVLGAILWVLRWFWRRAGRNRAPDAHGPGLFGRHRGPPPAPPAAPPAGPPPAP